MKTSTFISFLSSLAFIAPALALVAPRADSTTSVSPTITQAPVTTLPSSTTIYITSTPILSNISTSTGSGGSVSIVAASATWILPNPTGTPLVAGEYRLRTQVLDKGHARFNNLYLGAWALTYGFYADAAFTKNKTEAAKFFQNGTREQLDFGDQKQWSLTVNYDTLSSRWYGVSAHSPLSWSYGTYWLNGTGLEWTPNTSPPPHNSTLGALDAFFGGWMVCDWWHGVPQLFYKVGGFNDTVLPSTCANILLVQDYPRS